MNVLSLKMWTETKALVVKRSFATMNSDMDIEDLRNLTNSKKMREDLADEALDKFWERYLR